VKIPSDLLGIEMAMYDDDVHTPLASAVGSAGTRIRQHIEAVRKLVTAMSWPEFTQSVRDLYDKLRLSPSTTGFVPDIIIGMSRGGATVGDLISRRFGGAIPCITLWVDRHSQYPKAVFSPPTNTVNEPLITLLGNARFEKILLVDSMVRRGDIIEAAKSYLVSRLKGKQIRVAALSVAAGASADVDYVALAGSEVGLRSPFWEFD
jgi:hypoxanthine phosphoribosyltransferase